MSEDRPVYQVQPATPLDQIQMADRLRVLASELRLKGEQIQHQAPQWGQTLDLVADVMDECASVAVAELDIESAPNLMAIIDAALLESPAQAFAGLARH